VLERIGPNPMSRIPEERGFLSPLSVSNLTASAKKPSERGQQVAIVTAMVRDALWNACGMKSLAWILMIRESEGIWTELVKFIRPVHEPGNTPTSSDELS
jgi:hypothetical protein